MKAKDISISAGEQKIISAILDKVKKKGENKIKIMSFNRFYSFLNEGEKHVINKFKNIDPRKYGFKGTYFGLQSVPNNLIAIRNQRYKTKNRIEKISVQYLPKPVFVAYKKLNTALFKDIKRKILVDSGYRSSAHQMITFLWYLKFHKFDFKKTIKRVAIPGYSEHGFPKKQAIDFITQDGIPTDEKPLKFSRTIEYKWLLKNAHKFGFYQSYPHKNNLGIMFEPWHWQFVA